MNYVADPRGHPLLLLSGLAEHTRNLRADPRVSLLVIEEAADLQAAPRLTLLGTAEPAPSSEGARYLRHLPGSEEYFRLGDFSLYEIRPLGVRFIGGFGDIRWIGGGSYSADPGDLAYMESDVLTLWNHDHAHLLRAACAARGAGGGNVEIIGLDCDGLDIRADGRLLRVDFAQPVSSADAALGALRQVAGVSPA